MQSRLFRWAPRGTLAIDVFAHGGATAVDGRHKRPCPASERPGTGSNWTKLTCFSDVDINSIVDPRLPPQGEPHV